MRNTRESARAPLRASETRANLINIINGPSLAPVQPLVVELVPIKKKSRRKAAHAVVEVEKKAKVVAKMKVTK